MLLAGVHEDAAARRASFRRFPRFPDAPLQTKPGKHEIHLAPGDAAKLLAYLCRREELLLLRGDELNAGRFDDGNSRAPAIVGVRCKRKLIARDTGKAKNLSQRVNLVRNSGIVRFGLCFGQALSAGLAEGRQDIFHHPVAELLSARQIGAHHEAVNVAFRDDKDIDRRRRG